MSFIITVYTNEGIIMASDSRTTYSNHHPECFYRVTKICMIGTQFHRCRCVFHTPEKLIVFTVELCDQDIHDLLHILFPNALIRLRQTWRKHQHISIQFQAVPLFVHPDPLYVLDTMSDNLSHHPYKL